ncbi:MAG TPA: M17 family peptidase N-terminal domain-containing protein, partial [Pyrinomonadaceae bacterium]|nr:M17 family peptidase N-terminal domain-containing protein [Pyrinomonadaceae bacterium]
MANQNGLTFEIKKGLPPQDSGEAVAVCVFEGEPRLSSASDDILEVVEEVMRSGEFKGEAEASLVLHNAEKRGARTLILLGFGKHGGDSSAQLSRAAATALRRAREARVHHLYFIIPAVSDEGRMARAIAEGATLGTYDNDFYQEHEEPASRLSGFTIVTAGADPRELHAEVERGRIIAESVNWTRALADEPGGSLPPREFARRAALMAEEFG